MMPVSGFEKISELLMEAVTAGRGFGFWDELDMYRPPKVEILTKGGISNTMDW